MTDETLLHFAKQIAAREGRGNKPDGPAPTCRTTTTTLIINDKAFTVAQGWQQRGLWFATATDEAGETCLLTSPDGRDWEVLAPPPAPPPAPQYVEGGIYAYTPHRGTGRPDERVVLYYDDVWYKFGWGSELDAIPGQENMDTIDSTKIGDLLFVLD